MDLTEWAVQLVLWLLNLIHQVQQLMLKWTSSLPLGRLLYRDFAQWVKRNRYLPWQKYLLLYSGEKARFFPCKLISIDNKKLFKLLFYQIKCDFMEIYQWNCIFKKLANIYTVLVAQFKLLLWPQIFNFNTLLRVFIKYPTTQFNRRCQKRVFWHVSI